jgi:hypothetical protein
MTVELVRSSKFTTEQVDGALLTLAMLGGSTEKAGKELRAAGMNVTSRTLREWREKLYPGRYRDLCQRHARDIEGVIVRGSRAIAVRADEVTMLALEKARAQLKAGEARDPASVARNAAVTKAVNIDKMMLLEGRPTQVTEHRDADELMRAIRARVTVLDKEAAIDAEVIAEN